MRYGCGFGVGALLLCWGAACKPARLPPPPQPGESEEVLSGEVLKRGPESRSEIQYLTEQLVRGSRAERAEAIRTIAQLDDERFADCLLRQLAEEDDVFLKMEIMEVLVAFQEMRARPLLHQYTYHRDGQLAVAAVWALWRLGGDEGLDRLLRDVGEEDYPETRYRAHRLLVRIFGKPFPAERGLWDWWVQRYRQLHRR